MASISAEVVEARIQEYGRLWTIDDIIRVRAQDEVQSPILGYPKYDNSPTDYEYSAGRDLDRMVDETCHLLVRAGLKMNSFKTVALFAQSDLSFIVTFFAIFRLGCKALIMSIRLGEPACLNLLATADCDTIMYGNTARITATIADLKKADSSLHFMPIPARKDFDRPDHPLPEPFDRPIPDKEAEHVQISLIAHSSGSTGLPKPLFLSHRSIITTLPTGTGLRALNALPWYHIHGLFTSLMAMWMRQPAHLFNARLPLTAANLIHALREARPEICHCVPYTLKLMAEGGTGSRCSGSATGVKFGVIYGMTEVGHAGDSIYREPGDDTWDYVRPYSSLRPHMIFKPRGGGGSGGHDDVYEAVYLQSHPALQMSNSDDPPGSFHSKDLWTPHPTLPDAWKYVARDDDTVTLLSGEKILPLGIEGAIRESPLVRDVLMVGHDRLAPGVLFVDAVWPYVQAGNRLADEFARVARDMVVPVPADVDYPATDKGNVIRGAAHAQFRDYIDAMYAEKKSHLRTNGQETPLKKLDINKLEQKILDLLRDHVEIDMPDVHTDFFAAGVDSLRAAQIRRLLVQNFEFSDNSSLLPTNAIYDAGNVEKLAQKLYSMSLGDHELANGGQIITDHPATKGESESDLDLMQKLVDEYGTFERRKPGDLPDPERETVILTGATGALGAHILHLLLQDPQVDKIYCLVRSSVNNTAKDAADRVQTSLYARRLSTAASFPKLQQKLACLTTDDLGAPHLGLSSPAIFATLQATATLVVHAAWPVNFAIGLASFRPQLAGLRRLLDLAREVPFRRPARLLFTGSVSAAFGVPAGSAVPEGPLADWGYAAPTGYARSKLVGERMCELAAAAAAAAQETATTLGKGKLPISASNDGDDGGNLAANGPDGAATSPHVAVVRVGQISADTEHGIWNEKEAIPLLVRSAAQVGALPRLGPRQGRCEWMPVDTAARAILELAARMNKNGTKGLGNGGVEKEKLHADDDDSHSNGSTALASASAASFYNLVAPHHFSWNDDFLPAVRASGLLRFDKVDLAEWLARLWARAAELGAEAEQRLPAVKLAEYYEHSFMAEEDEGDKETSEQQRSAGLLTWEIGRACAHSEALRLCPQVIEAGLVPKMVRNWLEVDGTLIE
ncbi:hypothetical protein PG994_014424 [Apiospora phragmitis]|uniref:Carrier domain-containing protein n=1 Tax=Apiospora phragmitis TaxID=2905665 RepID=A0ABR1T4A6_9PEZI